MRLGVDLSNGLTKKGKLAIWIGEASRQCLFQMIFADPRLAVPVEEYVLDILHAVRLRLKLKSLYWYIMDLDVLSNTITLCPPIMNGETGEIDFRFDHYDMKVKKEGWPAIVLEVSPLWGFALCSVKTINPLGEKPLVESAAKPVAEIATQ